jgi:hypothetical protein
LLLAEDSRKRNAWHLATESSDLKILQKLWELGKEKLKPEDVRDKLLLKKDRQKNRLALGSRAG